jgi:hypothetical protein
MKLEMTLPERPGFLHVVPLLNIFAMVQLFFFLGPSLVWQSGVTVDLAPSRFEMERYRTPLVVTLGPGEPAPRIYLARDLLTMSELGKRFDELLSLGSEAHTIVLLQTDQGTPVGVEREVTELILGKGFRLAIAGKREFSSSASSAGSK